MSVSETSESFSWHGTTAHTQSGPQNIVSSVVLENEKKNLANLKEIKNRLSQHAPQLLEVFKLEKPFDTDRRELPLEEESWII